MDVCQKTGLGVQVAVSATPVAPPIPAGTNAPPSPPVAPATPPVPGCRFDELGLTGVEVAAVAPPEPFPPEAPPLPAGSVSRGIEAPHPMPRTTAIRNTAKACCFPMSESMPRMLLRRIFPSEKPDRSHRRRVIALTRSSTDQGHSTGPHAKVSRTRMGQCESKPPELFQRNCYRCPPSCETLLTLAGAKNGSNPFKPLLGSRS